MAYQAGFTACLFLVFLGTIPDFIHAAIRARYSVPRYHEISWGVKAGSMGSPNAAAEFNSREYLDSMNRGVWEGWELRKGFDEAPDDRWQAERLVDAGFWLDSVFEPMTALGAFVGNLEPLLAEGRARSAEGYIVSLSGGLRFPSPGEWVLYSAGDDGGTRVALDLDGNGNLDSSETAMWPDVRAGDPLFPRIEHPFVDERNWRRMQLLSVKAAVPGKWYRFSARYFNHSGKSHSGLFWKSGTMAKATPVPASAFGRRRNFGAPSPVWVSVATGSGKATGAQGPLVLAAPGDTVRFEARSPRVPGPVKPPRFIWDFGDGTVDSLSGARARHAYARGLFTPRVFLRWQDRVSAPAANRIVISVE